MALGPYALTTLGDLKAYLNIAGAENDQLLESLIDRVSELFEEFTNRNLKARDYHYDPLEDSYDPVNAVLDGNGRPGIHLPQFPVNSVTELRVDGREIPRANDHEAPGWIDDGRLKSSGILRVRGYLFGQGAANVGVAYNAGFVDAPKDLAQAAIEQAAWKFQEGYKARLGVAARTLAGGSVRVETGDLLPQVREVLERYRKRVVL